MKHIFQCLCNRLNELWGERAVGLKHCWRIGEAACGGSGNGFVCKLVLCCLCFWCGLAWLACLPAGVGVVYESLWWCGMWCGWVAKRRLCWATRRCTCQQVREGHRTHQTTILLEVSFSFSFSLQGFRLVCWFCHHQGMAREMVMGIDEAYFSMSEHPFECAVG